MVRRGRGGEGRGDENDGLRVRVRMWVGGVGVEGEGIYIHVEMQAFFPDPVLKAMWCDAAKNTASNIVYAIERITKSDC